VSVKLVCDARVAIVVDWSNCGGVPPAPVVQAASPRLRIASRESVAVLNVAP